MLTEFEYVEAVNDLFRSRNIGPRMRQELFNLAFADKSEPANIAARYDRIRGRVEWWSALLSIHLEDSKSNGSR